jgi:acylphosphatase
MPCLKLLISGRVQGVGYRVWLQREAQLLGLTGWVRNRRDGSVEVLVAGDAEGLSRLTAEAEAGPPASRVDRVDTEPGDEGTLGGAIGVEIRPTL